MTSFTCLAPQLRRLELLGTFWASLSLHKASLHGYVGHPHSMVVLIWQLLMFLPQKSCNVTSAPSDLFQGQAQIQCWGIPEKGTNSRRCGDWGGHLWRLASTIVELVFEPGCLAPETTLLENTLVTTISCCVSIRNKWIQSLLNLYN